MKQKAGICFLPLYPAEKTVWWHSYRLAIADSQSYPHQSCFFNSMKVQLLGQNLATALRFQMGKRALQLMNRPVS